MLGRFLIVALVLGVLRAGAHAGDPSDEDDDPLTCATRIDTDEHTRIARSGEHYNRGKALYDDEGRYDLAIPEFQMSYCLYPTPLALLAVGQSYERLVDYENAVRWYEAYIRLMVNDPAKRKPIANRVTVLRGLKATIRVATDPPYATVILEKDGVEVQRGEANRGEIKVPSGKYKVRAELEGYRTETDELDAEIGKPYSFVLHLTPKTGQLRVKAHPKDARIYVDGKIRGIGELDEPLPIGKHTVSIQATGRPTEGRDVEVSDDRAATISVRMRPPRPLNGRYEFLIFSTITGVIEGLGVGIATSDGNKPALIVGGGIGGAAVGFFLPYAFIPDYIPVGRTSTVVGMSFTGAFVGAMVGSLVRDKPVNDQLVEDDFTVGMAVGVSVAATTAAWIVTKKIDVSPGDASLLNSAAMWGATAGVLLATGSKDEPGRLIQSFALGGIGLGLVGGALLGSRFEYSRGHVALIDLAGLVGMSSAGAIAWFGSGNEELSSLVALGGMAVGLVGGGFITRKMDIEPELAPLVETAEDVAGNDVTTFGLSARW